MYKLNMSFSFKYDFSGFDQAKWKRRSLTSPGKLMKYFVHLEVLTNLI